MKIKEWVEKSLYFLIITLMILMPIIYILLRAISIRCNWKIVALYYRLGPAAWATFYLAAITGVVIWRQVYKLQQQIVLQTISGLYEEWNSKEMWKKREECAKEMLKTNSDHVDYNKIETVLEFLEKVCSYYKKNLLNRYWLWDNLGFYIERYYYYNKENIPKIRDKWKDNTLYEDMQTVYPDLIKDELKSANKDKKLKCDIKSFETNLADTKTIFFESEQDLVGDNRK